MDWSKLVAIVWLIVGCFANTETHLIKIPYYYEIPPCFDNRISSLPSRLNDTVSIIDNYPIDSIDYEHQNHEIEVDYDANEKPLNTVLVKVNNYNNRTFDANELIFIKVCWPALSPYDVDISHIFTNDLNNSTTYLDLYLIIQYQMYAKSFNQEFFNPNDHFKFQLYMTKLPNKLPIPLELYGIIMYLVDLSILVVTLVPYLWNWIFENDV